MIVVNRKKTILLLVLSILIVIGAVVSVTFAYLSVSATQTQANTLNTACYDIEFSDSSSINLTSYPMSSANAFKLTPYTFSIKNSCEANTSYQVILNIKNTTSTELLKYIDYSLDGVTVNKLSSLSTTTLPSGATSEGVTYSYVLDTGNMLGINASNSYKLYLWIDESAGNDIMGSTFEAEVMVYSAAM